MKQPYMKNDVLNHTIKFNNLIPLLSSVVMVVASTVIVYSKVDKRLALIEQNQTVISDKIDTLIEKYASVELRYGKIALQVQNLETLEGERHRD